MIVGRRTVYHTRIIIAVSNSRNSMRNRFLWFPPRSSFQYSRGLPDEEKEQLLYHTRDRSIRHTRKPQSEVIDRGSCQLKNTLDVRPRHCNHEFTAFDLERAEFVTESWPVTQSRNLLHSVSRPVTACVILIRGISERVGCTSLEKRCNECSMNPYALA